MLPDVKTAERTEAVRLRKDEGRSVREIAEILGVARSSVSRWVRDVELSAEQLDSLHRQGRVRRAQRLGAEANARRSLVRRSGYQARGRALAREGSAVYAAGCMLYWAEGAKTRNTACFTNSDPAMMRFFVDFLRRFFDLADHEFRVSCNLYADHASRIHEVENFWLDVMQLPRSCLLASTVNHYSPVSRRKRRNFLPHGTCRVLVHRTDVIQTIFGSIQELGGFTRSEWLTN
jgi:transposase-like protein